MEVTVRNLTGSLASVVAAPSETLGSIRRSVQDQWGSKCILRLHLRGSALKDKTSLSELQLRPGEFLVALDTKKARQTGQPSTAGQLQHSAATLSAAASTSEALASATLQSVPTTQPIAQGLPSEPYQQISPAVSPWSSPYRTQLGISPADTPIIASGGHTPLVSSPVSSENTFSLLPGYLSRPGPSPQKRPRPASSSRDPGGFIIPGDGSKAPSQAQAPASKAHTSVQQHNGQRPDSGKGAACKADEGEEDAVWMELAEELRQIPQLPEEAVQGVEDADSGQGLLQRLRQAAGRGEADAAALDRLVDSEAAAAPHADKEESGKRSRPVRKQTRTKAAGFDPHLMLSRLAQPVTKLTAKEAAVVAELPLPPGMQRLEHIFQALNAVHSFLLSAHIQATWRNVRKAVRNIPGAEDTHLSDVEAMADLCPAVVIVRNRHRFDSPRSVRHMMSAERKDSGDSSSGEDPIPVNKFNPAEIRTDGSGTTLKGERSSFVIEIIDPGQKSAPPATSLEQMHVAPGDDLLDNIMKSVESVMGGPSLGSKRMPMKQTQTERGVNNANLRRWRAFRAGLVRAVALLHDSFLQQRRDSGPNIADKSGDDEDIPSQKGSTQQKKAGKRSKAGKDWQWSPLKEGSWHPDFAVDKVTVAEAKQAVQRDEARRAAERGSGSADEADPIQTGLKTGRWGETQRKGAAPRPPQLHRRHEPCTMTNTLSPPDFVEHLKTINWYKQQIAHVEVIPARAPKYGKPDHPLPESVTATLERKGIKNLFCHQAEALNAVSAGKHVVVCTATASGKSLCYNLPILEALVQDPRATALYMFPTKALAQDQLRALRELCDSTFGKQAPFVDIYDGDTPKEDRGAIRDRAHLLITNPDMLHCSMLPVHRQFGHFLANLHYVVVDEGHAYRGVFGCHAALVLRRLRRICQREYRRSPQFIVASATIANPQEHIQQLLGVDHVHVVSEDGSPHGPKSFVLWNPPFAAPDRKGSGGKGLSMSHTEGRKRGGAKRKQAEWMRSKLQESEQARRSGTKLGSPGSEADWMAAVRLGRKRRAVGAETLSEITGMDLEAAKVAVDSAKDTQLITMNKLLTPPQLGTGSRSGSESDSDAEAHLQPYAYEHDAAMPPDGQGSSSSSQRQHSAKVVSTPQKSLQAGQGGGSRSQRQHLEQGVSAAQMRAQQALRVGSGSIRLRQSSEHGSLAAQNAASQAAASRPGSSRPDEEDIRAAEAVVRSTMLPIQATVQQQLRAQEEDTLNATRATIITWTQQLELAKAAEVQVNEQQELRKQEEYMHGPDIFPRALIKRSTAGMLEIPDGKTGKMSSKELAERKEASLKRGQRVSQLIGNENKAQREHREEVQKRLPSTQQWKSSVKEAKERHGAAGVPSNERRVSPTVELSLLLAECIQHGLRTIAFCHTRKLTELVTAYTRETLKSSAPHLASSISVYRAGYSPEERRQIERALFEGKLWAVAATNALELGVDVGSLDATLHLGFPGSVASLWQQAGRAGRREQPSISIYIGFDGPLDQFFMHQPENLFSRPIEMAQIDPGNEQLLQQHLACAAAEMPLHLQYDREFFGHRLPEIASFLQSVELLNRHPQVSDRNVLHYTGSKDNPARQINLRAIDPERYTIVNEANNGEVLEEIEESNAFWEVYDGAVYLYQGRTYLCKKLDLSSKVAVVRPADLKYYTKTRDFTDVYVVGGKTAYHKPKAHSEGETLTAGRCDECEVTTRWLGFYRVWQGSGEVFDTVDLFLPDVQFNTQVACIRVPQLAWSGMAERGLPSREALHAASHTLIDAAYIRVPQSARREMSERGLPFREGLHAASHALINVVPLFLLCNSSDLGAECDNPYDTRFRPERLLIYDKHPGGIGLAKQAQPLFPQLLTKALELVRGCNCRSTSGCPACIQSMSCDEYNAVLHKDAGIAILEMTLAAEAEYAERLQKQMQEAQVEGGFVPNIDLAGTTRS